MLTKFVDPMAAYMELDDVDRGVLEQAARGMDEGGDKVPSFLAERYADLGLIYRCSGRLRPVIYKLHGRGGSGRKLVAGLVG